MEAHGTHAKQSSHDPGHGATATMPGIVKDPVCGMDVDPAKTAHHADHADHAYHFCSAGCRTKFVADPAKYVHPRAPLRAEPVAPGTIYTCPMHPQIRQPGPGSCPICGMALEPET
ncbi:MAG: heavy metal-binding domain-containing protein, partial [Pseudomonadota bacterium]